MSKTLQVGFKYVVSYLFFHKVGQLGVNSSSGRSEGCVYGFLYTWWCSDTLYDYGY